MKNDNYYNLFSIGFWVVLFGISVPMQGQTYGPNLVLNPGFESGQTSWTNGGNNNIEATHIISGIRSMRYSAPTGAGGSNQNVTVLAGAIYKFGFSGFALDAYGAPGGTNTGKTVSGIVKNGSTVLLSLPITSNNITTVSAEVTIPVGVTSINISTYKASGVCTVDDILLQLKQWTISTSASNGIMGVVNGGGIVASNSTVSLVATPNSGYHFVNWTENDVEVSTSSTYEFTASSDRTLVANFAANTAVPLNSGTTNVSSLGECATCDVTVATGAELNVDGDKTLYSLNVAAGGKLTFSGGALTTTNGITLESTTDGSATLVDEFNSPTVSATVKQYVTAGRNWYLSSPLSAAAFGALNRGTSVVEWNEATKAWDAKSSGTLTPGKGYIQVATSNPSVTGTTGTIDFTGTTNSGNVAVTLTRTESGSNRGFNLVGNPYPSYLKWSGENGVIADAGNNGIGTSFWYRTKNTSDAYIFVTHNGTTGYTIPADQTSNTTITGKIPPMQAFWVRVNQNVNTEDPIYPNNSVTLTFKNNMREHGIGDGNKLKAPKYDDRKRLRLQLSNGIATDETLIFFDELANDNFDKYDSPKMMNNSVIMPDLYSRAGNEKVGINGLSFDNGNFELPLGFNLLSPANLKLKTTEMVNFDSSTKVYLLDKTTNTESELQTGTEYNFSITESATNNESRFSLLFRAPDVSTQIDNTVKLNAQVFVNAENQLTIIAPDKCTYAIYNSLGQMISKGTTNAGKTVIDLKSGTGANSANGFYVVNVSDTEKAVTTKVIIQ